MKKLILLSLPAIAALFLTGCMTTNLQDEDERACFSKNQEVGDKIANSIYKIDRNANVLVASFVTANDLAQTDGFGRIAAEQVSSCIVNRGLKVVEPRLRHDNSLPEVAISNDPAGEFALSRDVQRLVQESKADFVVTGVYSYGKYQTIVTIKVIDRGGTVRAAYNYTVPATVFFDWDRNSLKQTEIQNVKDGNNEINSRQLEEKLLSRP